MARLYLSAGDLPDAKLSRLAATLEDLEDV